jgi:hypothetical protein
MLCWRWGASSHPIQLRALSANAYDYSNADPVSKFDISGEEPYDNDSALTVG